MHLTNTFLFAAIGALAAHDVGTSQPSHKLPIYNSVTTKTGFSDNGGLRETGTYVTKTRILYVTHTLTVIEATKSSDRKDLPSYSFVDNDGKTEWLGGKTPPASKSYHVATSYLTIQPIAKTITVTSSKSVESVQAHRGAAYTGVGKGGWNSTASRTLKTESSQDARSTKQDFASNVHTTFSGTASPERYPAARAYRERYLRAARDLVIATIDGEAASWTNSLQGPTASTVASIESQPSASVSQSFTNAPASSLSSAALTTSSPLVLPVYPWDLNVTDDESSGAASSTFVASTPSVSTIPSESSSSAQGPSTTVEVYPWDLAVQPILTTTSSNSVGSSPSASTVSSVSTSSSPSPSTAPDVYAYDLAGQPISTSTSPTPTPQLSSSTPASPSNASSAETSTLSSPSPSITLAVYPWDLAFQPAASSTSTLSTVISSTSSCSSASSSFTVTFDDLPTLDISSDPADTDISPLPTPYRKLYWQTHFGYVPPPSDPFPPNSPPQLAVYRSTSNTSTPSTPASSSTQLPGELGAGPRSSNSAFWIDAHSMYLGCADGSSSPCNLTVNGYRYGSDAIATAQSFSLPPCPELQNCVLQLVEFTTGMTQLSGLQIVATSVEGTPLDYYLDDLALSWSDNSCAAQQERASSA